MIDNEIRQHLESLTLHNALDVPKALEVAISALINWGGDENAQAAITLMAIYDQRGCEHLDCGHNPDNAGRLTQAISVIVFG